MKRHPMRLIVAALWSASLLAMSATSALALPTIATFDLGDLSTVSGPGSFAYYNGATTSGSVGFGTATSFGLPTLPSGNPNVMAIPAFAQNQGILLAPGVGPNGGGSYLNDYTFGFDMLVPNVSASYFAFWNTSATNTNDAEAFINPSNAGIGISGDYEGQIQSAAWHRVLFTVEGSTTMRKYIDGQYVGSTGLSGVDGRWAAYTAGDGVPTYLFTDDNGETNSAYIASILFEDRVYSDSEVATLGTAHAAGLTTAGTMLPPPPPPPPAQVSQFEWTFDKADLSLSKSLGGVATLNYFNADAQSATQFGSTATNPSVPDLPDGPGNYLYHPVFGNGGASGYGVDFVAGVDANAGGSYVNTYTYIADVYLPALGWTPLFNTNTSHANDADFYITPGGALGIGELGYSSSGVIQAGQWQRIAFVYDSDNNMVSYYVDGAMVFQGPAGSLDGRFSIYPDSNAGFDLLFDGEGDGSGNYTNEVYFATLYFSNQALTPEQIRQLGGASRFGVLPTIPEPNTLLVLAGAAGLMLRRRRRHHA